MLNTVAIWLKQGARSIFSLGLLILLVTPQSFTQTPLRNRQVTDLIGYVGKDHSLDGCGCAYYLQSDSSRRQVYSFVEDPWMNIDGEDVRLTRIKTVSVPKGPVKKGQRTTENLVGGDAKITIVTVVTKGPSDSNEGSDYTGTITVVKNGREQTVKIAGFCGC